MNRNIFGWERSGTKFLANAHEQNGYFNFGEFFNVFSCEVIKENIPYAKRLSISIQRDNRIKNKNLHAQNLYFQKAFLAKDRIELFQIHKHLTPSIVTVWIDDIKYATSILDIISDRYFLCTVRKNKTEQLLSSIITNYNLNFNGEEPTISKKIEMKHVDYFYDRMKNTTIMQEEIVKNKKGRYVDFDALISGNEDLGFEYKVTSIDQHEDVTKYFINLTEVLDRISYLEKNT